MKKKIGINEIVLLEGGYLLRDVFEDAYEYEEYFKLINSTPIQEYFPADFDVEFDVSAKAPRLRYPKDRSDYVVLVLPLSKNAVAPRKRSALRQNALEKYAGLIPKIRLEMKDELAMRKKLLAPAAERELIDKLVNDARRRGLRRLKERLQKSPQGKAGARRKNADEDFS
jgi:hypothetical protein